MLTGDPSIASYSDYINERLSELDESFIVLNPFNQPVGNYIVTDSGESTINIDLSSSSSGWYQTALVINGIIADTQNFIKQ